jgi:Type I phosphodiesterase / nucleotide pyrophosphatase
MLRRSVLAALLGCLLASALVAAAERPHVYLVVVDGLDARFVTRERMPRLFATIARDAPRSSYFPAAHAAMPARTDTNHAALLTGTQTDAHGITGNDFWNRVPGATPQRFDAPELFEVETLFTVAETRLPSLVTVGVFAKPKLARMFGAAPGRQRVPDYLWSPASATGVQPDLATGYTTDADTMAAVLDLLARVEPDLLVVNLADVDRTAHGAGPDHPSVARAVEGADAAIGRLIATLDASGRWERSVLLVTADHGFTSLVPTTERPYPVIPFGRDVARVGIRGVRLVAEGGVEHVYAEGVAAGATDVGAAAAALAQTAALARETEGIVEVVARLPVPGVPLLRDVHPDWHLEHPRVGELVLVAAPGHQFVDPWDPVDAGLRGNHGGPGDLAVPLFVTGGSRAVVSAPRDAAAPSAADVGATLAVLLGLPPPERVGGGALTPAARGEPIATVLAPDAAQSPH